MAFSNDKEQLAEVNAAISEILLGGQKNEYDNMSQENARLSTLNTMKDKLEKKIAQADRKAAGGKTRSRAFRMTQL